MEIEGKKVVVVGGASGFGKATAELLAKRGASVAVLDRPQSKGKEVADAIGGSFYEVDVTDFDGTEKVLKQAIDGLGGLHIVVTTAGGGTAERTVKKDGPHSLESFRKCVDLNLIGTFNISRLAGWEMSQQDLVDDEQEERGVIINTASIAAFEGQIGQVAYTASKAAIAGMCLTMARDMVSLGIRRLAIAPCAHRSDRRHPRRVRQGPDEGRGVPEASRAPGGVRQARPGDRREPDAQRPVPAARRRPALRTQVVVISA